MDEKKTPEAVESTLPELPEAELNLAVGGTKLTDKASPTLMTVCATGKHIDESK